MLGTRLVDRPRRSAAALVVFTCSLVCNGAAPAASSAAQLIGPECLMRATKNLVSNGDFEEPGDQGRTRGAWFLDTTTKAAGKYSLCAKGSTDRPVRRDQNLDLDVGQTYTLSAWMKADALTTAGPGHNSVGAKVIDAGWHWAAQIGPDGPTSDWKRYTVTFTAPPSTSRDRQFFHLVLYVPRGETGLIWVDNLQVERGDRATEFTSKSIPDLRRTVHLLNEADATLRGIGAAQELLSPATAAMDTLRDGLAATRADIEVCAGTVRGFAAQDDQVWRQTVATVRDVSSGLRENAWHTWWTNPWQRYSRRQAPLSLGQAEAKRMRVAVNDYVAAALMITNLSDSSIEMRVRMLAGGRGPQLPNNPRWAKLRLARMVSPTDRPTAEYPTMLASLDDSQSVKAAPAETTQVWIDVDTVGLEPGTYRAELELTPYRELRPQSIPFSLDVVDVVLPKHCPAEVFCWGLNPLGSLGETAEMSQEQLNAIQDPWLEDLARHGINRVLHHTQTLRAQFAPDGSLSRPLDFVLHDMHLASKRRYVSKFVGGYSVAHYYMPSLGAPDEEFATRFASMMKAWLSHLRELGITPDAFPLELLDEPSGDRLIRNRLAHKVLKQVAPDWKTMAAISIDTAAGLQSLVPIMDIMVVNPGLDEAADQVLRESGREIWTYVCEGSLEVLEPYQYYRLLPWKTWHKGYAGFGFYWTMQKMPTPRGNFYSPFYYGNAGPVPTRGWQAFRRGTRDWTILHALRTAIRKARGQGHKDAATGAEAVLRQAVQGVLGHPGDEAQAEQWRTRILDQLLKLAPG